MAHEDGHHETPGKPGEPLERRFVSAPTRRANYRALLGGLGAAVLGAASYAQWMREPSFEAAPILFLVGIAALIVSLMMGDPAGAPIRVGDGGVAAERGGPPYRIAWYEVERVALEDGKRVVIEGRAKRIEVPVATQEGAAAWIVKEARERIHDKVQIDPDELEYLLRGTQEHGALVPLERPQVAGRRCKASGVIISFEQDACLCKQCGEIYDRKHVPAQCMCCGAQLAG
jgi:hypothetical protein